MLNVPYYAQVSCFLGSISPPCWSLVPTSRKTSLVAKRYRRKYEEHCSRFSVSWIQTEYYHNLSDHGCRSYVEPCGSRGLVTDRSRNAKPVVSVVRPDGVQVV